MDFTINKDTLKKAIDFVSLSLMQKTPDAILDNILIEAPDTGESKIRLTAAGQDTTSSAEAEASVTADGSILFPGKMLARLAKTLDGIEVQIKKDNNSVKVKSGRYDGSFQSPDPASFPAAIQKDGDPVLTITRADLLSNLQTLEFAVNKDPAKRQLSAVNITKNGMCSTNGRVSFIIAKEIPLPEGTNEINIPAQTIPCLISTLKKSSAENVSIYEQDSYLVLDMDDEHFFIRKVNITFPPVFERVDVPTKERNDKSLTLDNIELKSALKRVALTSDSKDSAVEFVFKFDGMAGDSVVLTSADGSTASSKEEMDAEFNGFELNGEGWNISTKFDSAQLEGVLDAVKSDTVTFTFCDDVRVPVRIVDEDLILLVMRVI